MTIWGEKFRSANYVLFSTLLHSSAIIVIALAPTYFPDMMGSSEPSVERVEFSVNSPAEPVMAVEPVAPPVAPLKIKKVSTTTTKEIKVAQALPNKAPQAAEPVLAQVEAPLEQPVAPPAETSVAEETPVVEESPVVVAAPAPTIAPVPVVDEEKIKLQEQLAAAETLKTEQAKELADLKAKQDELVKTQEAARAESEKIAQEKIAQAEAARLAAENAAAQQAEAFAAEKAAAAQKAEAAAKAGAGSGSSPEKIIVKQDFLQLRQLPGNKAPNYTREMRLNKLAGRGQLVYFVTQDGLVNDLKLIRSSGHSELDQAAMDAFKKFKFVPGQEGRTVHNFEFNLKGPAESDRGRLRTSNQ